MRLINVHVVHPYSSNDTAMAGKIPNFILSDKPDFHRIDNPSIAVYTFSWLILTSLSVDVILLPSYVN